jgi:RNA polymerase sigma-70 factor (ECF subfamily)
MTGLREPESELLMRAATGGDERARAEILSRYRERLKRMIAIRLDKRISARVDPSDVVQEALKDAHRRLREYFDDPQISFYPWLRRIASDRLTDTHRIHLAAEKRSVLKEHAWTPDLNDESVAELAQSIVTSSVAPAEQAMQTELLARATAALLQLKAHDREILVMRYLEQLGVPEIAEVLGISQTAVTSRHLRALQRLRRALNDGAGIGNDE